MIERLYITLVARTITDALEIEVRTRGEKTPEEIRQQVEKMAGRMQQFDGASPTNAVKRDCPPHHERDVRAFNAVRRFSAARPQGRLVESEPYTVASFATRVMYHAVVHDGAGRLGRNILADRSNSRFRDWPNYLPA